MHWDAQRTTTHFMDFPDATSVVEDSFRQSCFPRVDVGRDTDVSLEMYPLQVGRGELIFGGVRGQIGTLEFFGSSSRRGASPRTRDKEPLW